MPCMHECRHPLWGGDGICLEETEYSPAVCSCDADFASRDALGNASCVPKRVLVTGYIVLAIASVLTLARLLWDINQYRYLPSRCRSSKKTALRMRTLVCCTIFVLGWAVMGIALAVRAGDTGFFDDGVVQVTYIVLLPTIMFGVAMVAESWVANLPSQLVSPENFAGKLRFAAEKHYLFSVIGILNAGTVSAFGIMTFINPVLALVLADIAIAAGSVMAIAAIVFVTVRITITINQAVSKGSASGIAFYVKAKKNLWVQAAGLCSLSVLYFFVTTIRHLTMAGRSTPVILYNAQMLCGHVLGIIISLGTRFDAKAKTETMNSTSMATGIRRVATVLSDGGTAALALLPLNQLWSRQGGQSTDDNVGNEIDDHHENKVFPIRTKPTPRDGVVPEEKALDRQPGIAKISSVLPTEDPGIFWEEESITRSTCTSDYECMG